LLDDDDVDKAIKTVSIDRKEKCSKCYSVSASFRRQHKLEQELAKETELKQLGR
jgi:hypothetical protein